MVYKNRFFHSLSILSAQSLTLIVIVCIWIVACTPKVNTSAQEESTTVVTSSPRASSDEKSIPKSSVSGSDDSLLNLIEHPLTAPMPQSDEFLLGQLDNGMTYYIKQNNKPSDKLELRLVINAGSILEEHDQQGLAHFLEHMLFNGTSTFEKNKLIDYLQRHGVKFGAHINAYTSFDETVYMLSIPTENPGLVDTSFQILEDWAHRASLTDEEIDKERGVVLEEFRIGLGADKRMMQEYLPKLFYDSRYAKRLPIGKKEIIENAPYESIRRFYRDWYRPDLMAIVVVGDIDPSQAKSKIEEHFGNISTPHNPPLRSEYNINNHRDILVSVTTDPEAAYGTARVYYKRSRRVESLKTQKDYLDKLIRTLVTNMLNKRYAELLRSADPPFVYGGAGYGRIMVRNKSGLQAYAVVGENEHLNSLQVLLEEIERMKDHGFLPQELARAKNDLLTSYEKSFNEKDKTKSIIYVDEFQRHFLLEESIPGITWEYDFIQKILPTVSIEDVNATAKNMVSEDNIVLILTGPEKENTRMPSENDVIELYKRVSTDDLTPYIEEATPDQLMEKPTEVGHIVTKTTDSILGATEFVLSNGIRVSYKVTDFKNDQILFNATSKGGTNYISDSTYQRVAYALDAISSGGLNGMDQTSIDKYLQGSTASISSNVGETTESLSGSTSPKDLETLMQLIHLSFTALYKNPESYQSYKTRMKQLYANLAANPQYYFYNEMSKIANEENPRHLSWANEEDWEQTDFDLAYDIYVQRFSNPADFHFSFVGNIDPKLFEQLTISYLSSLPTDQDKREQFIDLEYRTYSDHEDLTIYRGSEPKSMTILSYDHPSPYSREDQTLLGALADVLQITLIENLREEMSGVYTVSASGHQDRLPYERYNFSVRFPSGPDKQQELLTAVQNEIAQLISKGPDPRNVEKVIQAMLKKHKEAKEENAFWLSVMKNEIQYSYDRQQIQDILTNYDTYIKDLVTVENLRSVAQKYLTKDYVIYTLLPEEEK